MPLPDSLQAARLLCANRWPYLTAGLWAMQPVESKGLGTLAVDKYWRLYYDPKISWPVDQLASVLYHEMNHLLRQHPQRAELQAGLDGRAWNICADAEINDDLVKEPNVKLPEVVIVPSMLKMPDGLLAEEYYQKLPKMTIKVSGTGKGDCGSCADGQQRAHEQDAPANAGGKGEAPGLSEAEGDLVRNQIAHDIRSQTPGTVPNHLKLLADALLNPKIDWRKVLRAMVRHSLAEISGQVDYTYKRLSRRQGCVPRVVLPAMIEPIPRVSVVVDTSGSIGGDALIAAISEVGGILKACGQRDSIRVIACDAAVHSAKRVWKASQVELSGGGGTDMGVGIAKAMQDKPHLIVVLTDGYTPWPQAVGAKVLVALIGNKDTAGVPSYAKAVIVE